MFSIHANKSPGLDGYGSHFYKASWNEVGEDVAQVALSFFSSRKILKEINATSITLIPKIKCPNSDQLETIDLSPVA